MNGEGLPESAANPRSQYDPENDDHATDVIRVEKADGLRDWRAWCRICGPFGPESHYRADAESIADRHKEIGGFERH